MLEMLLPFAGKVVDTIFGQAGANADRKAQLDAAKNSVQWRVEDANKAGVHPLAALGMNPISVAPTSVGTDFGSMGADVSRAVAASSTGQQRMDALTAKLLETQVEGAGLDNDIKRAELASHVARVGGAGVGPPVPAVGPNTARGADVGGQVIPPVFGLPHWETGRTGTAEEIERQYGDVIQEVYGMGRLAQDAWWNFDNWSRSWPEFIRPPRYR